MLAMTGVITSTTEKNTLITLLQDMEYIHGQLFERSVESGCGSVTCLPGALTILRFSAFRKMAKYYFADKAEQCDDLFDYGKCHLGEDRWLTHLFMIGAKERYQIQMCTGAFCKTEAVQTYRSLLKQRRRWFLGFITNEVCMLTDIRLWKRYPILCVVRFMQNTIRTTALLFFIMVLSIITTSNKVKNLPVGFIAVSLGLNWLLMFYFGLQLRRFKAWLYPIMFIINPFFNWVYMIYGIFTAGQRTWGGPRADAGSADTNTTVQAAIEHAEATGDDLNIVPETFKPATLAKKQKGKGASTGMSLQPSDNLDGRFAQAEKLPGGWYHQDNDSNHTLPDMLERNPNAPHVPLHPRSSFDSFDTNTSNGNSIYLPRRVESIMGDEDRRKYMVAQSNQREAGGAYMVENREHLGTDENNYGKRAWGESVESLGSDQSYPCPQRPPRSRAGSNYSATVPGPRATSKSPTRYEHHRSNATPKVVEQAHLARARSSVAASMNPQGSSPLARLSFVRTPGNEGVAVETAQQQELPHSQSEPAFPHRRGSSGDNSSRGRSPDGRRRNRLTKSHRSGRSG
jgi:chitin synthase